MHESGLNDFSQTSCCLIRGQRLFLISHNSDRSLGDYCCHIMRSVICCAHSLSICSIFKIRLWYLVACVHCVRFSGKTQPCVVRKCNIYGSFCRQEDGKPGAIYRRNTEGVLRIAVSDSLPPSFCHFPSVCFSSLVFDNGITKPSV